jgi:hypothetical protein
LICFAVKIIRLSGERFGKPASASPRMHLGQFVAIRWYLRAQDCPGEHLRNRQTGLTASRARPVSSIGLPHNAVASGTSGLAARTTVTKANAFRLSVFIGERRCASVAPRICAFRLACDLVARQACAAK